MHQLDGRLRTHSVRTAVLALAAAVAFVLLATTAAYANVPITQVSTSDPYTDTQAQHRTQVEPDTFGFGNTIVAAFQTGRVFGGGASNIGWATSTNRGASWSSGFLPGITAVAGGSFGQASDPAVAFDARHNVWMISSLAISGSSEVVLTSRSTNGGLTWLPPVTTATGSNDKNWIVCDNTSTSPFFGTCYTEYDVTSSGNAIRMRRSSDGGATWQAALSPSGGASGLGGQPVVRPNGTVIVPYLTGNQIRSFRSIDGGVSWRSTILVATVNHHTTAGGLRSGAIPSAEIDNTGTVYLAWSDCRFRSGCPSNDIVVAKSTSETTWAAPTRVPIDVTTSTVDHLVPGIGVDRSTGGGTARVGLTYYSYPVANCTSSTCRLNVGFISSTNGGASWSTATQIAGPMTLSWLPNTSQGRMFGDYISTSVLAGGNAFPVIPVAVAPSGSTFNVAMYIPSGGLAITGGAARAGASPTFEAATAAPATAAPQTLN